MGKYRNPYSLTKRYGVEEGRFTKAGQNYTDDEDPRDFHERLAKEVSRDYDSRKHQETFDLAYTNADFAKTLNPEIQDFLDDYRKNTNKKKKKNTKGIDGIDTLDDVFAINDFGKLWHQHEGKNKGKYTSTQDYSEATSQMMSAMRDFYGGSSAQDAEPKKKPKVKTPKSLLPKNYTPSKETTDAQNFVDQYERSIRNSPDGLLDTGSMGESQTLKGTSFNAEDASEENDKAQGFFQDQILNLTEGFKKYNINTVGPNSTASKNRDLLRTFKTT